MSRDPYRYFRIEARELLEQMTQSALAFEKSAVSVDALAGMLRLAHTLKGAARVVKQREIAEQAHAIEDLLAPHRDVEEPLSPSEVEAILQGLDSMRERVAGLAQPPAAGVEHSTPPTSGEAAATPALGADLPLPPAARGEEVDQLLDVLDEAGAECSRLRGALNKIAQLRQVVIEAEHAWEAARQQRSVSAEAAVATAFAGIRETVGASQRALVDGVEQLSRELLEAGETARRLRLQRAGQMFLALEIAARDAAQGVGRRIDFVSVGKDERLDAKVFAVMQQALVQSVRNAVAHGLESDEERREAGKAVPASITIQVVPRGRRTLFVCRDDGRGIDLAAVRRALQARDMTPERIAAMNKAQLLQSLLLSRISTSRSVTQLSGRGIGLDVMRQAAESLGGSITLASDEGVGTSIEFDIPTSIAAVDALVVEAAGRAVAIPLRAVRRTLRVAADDLAHSPHGAALLIGSNVVPFVSLARALRQPKSILSPGMSTTAVLVEKDGALAALGVDRLRGTQNLIVRPLPEFAAGDPVVAGASLDAEGMPQLMLDPEQLVDFVRQAGAEAPAAAPKRLPVLVIDDSLTTRMLEQSILESAGYEVDAVVCAEDGLVQARGRRYSLILVDVEMPGMSGFEFVERVRADPELKDIPAILVTSRSAPEDRERGMRAGANGYIVKGNFDQGELLDSIRAW